MAAVNTTPTPKYLHFRLPGGTRKTAVVLAAVLLLAAGGYWWYHHSQQAKKAAQPYSHSYSQVGPYKLAGFNAGNGVLLAKPIEYGSATTSSARASQIQFGHILTKNKDFIQISTLAVASVPTVSSPSQAYLKGLSQEITDVHDRSHASTVTPIHGFVSQRLNAGYSFKWSVPIVATLPHIKTNLWLFNFTANAKDSKNVATLPPLTGEALLVAGKKAFYYYFVDAVSYNWQANADFWQKQVIDSLQIDQ